MVANNPLNLDEPGEWAGLWWLPDKPEHQVPGVLRYEHSAGLVLSLIGTFEDRIMTTPTPGLVMVHEGHQTWHVIHGAAEQRAISLLDCVPGGGKRTMGAQVKTPDKQTILATTALIGAHVPGEAEAVFSAVELSVENLGLWAATSVLERSLDTVDGRTDGSGSISVKPVQAQSVEVDGSKFVLAHSYTRPFFDQRRGGTIGCMRDTPYIRIVPRHASSLTQAMGSAGLIQDLVTLATHRAAGLIWLRLKLDPGDLKLCSGRPQLERNVDVLYSPSVIGKRDANEIDHRRVFFTCDTLPFETIIPRWCEIHARLRPALNMVFGLRYAPARYVETNLLTAAGAAEVFHRGLDIDQPPIPSKEFKLMRESMLVHVPEEYKEGIRRLIRNAPTLRDRLHALAARPDQEAMSVLVPDVSRWVSRTTRARNDLAHEGRTPNHSPEELIAVADVTAAVVIMNILNEVGLPPERQREIVHEHPQLKSTARMAREWLSTP